MSRHIADGVRTAVMSTKWATPEGLYAALNGIAAFHRDYKGTYEAAQKYDEKVATEFKERYGNRF